jgi:hypothetical protein
MADPHSIRELHSQLADAVSSLEALFSIVDDNFDQLNSACQPAMLILRRCLDDLDLIIPTD